MPFLDPTVQVFLDAMQLGSVTTQEGTIHETRARLEAMQASTNPSLDSVDYETLDIPVGPTGSVNIHIYKPKGHEGLVPTLIYIHGGYPACVQWKRETWLIRAGFYRRRMDDGQ